MIIYYPTVAESIKDKDKPPISWKEWKEAFEEIKDEAKEAAHNAQAAASHYPLIKNGIWYVWNAKSGKYISTGVEAEGTTGEPGRNGTDGQDGVSPAITVTDIPGGHRITFTDAEHPNGQTVDVMDGENGSDGLPGTPGSNGVDGTTFTPSVSAAGDLSWSNDGGKTNPETVNIKGATGAQGPPGSSGAMVVETVIGTTPSITGADNHRYICGEAATLSITAPESGSIDVLFVSGSTATVLTVNSAKSGVTAIKWANGFDPTSLDANTTYEINILDGEYGVACAWT